MEKEFHKDLSHLSWDEVYNRQKERAFLLPGWLEELDLQPGDHVLDLGSGPGYMSLRIAEQVGPGGLVYAIDRSAEALEYLQDRMRQESITNIRCVAAEASTLELHDEHISSVLLTMVLHHADDPAAVISHLAELLPDGARIVIAEFYPQSPAQSGPPQAARIAPEQIVQWCQEAGLQQVGDVRPQSDEHYMLVVQQRGELKSK
ncbi:class I SAM-dependent methyltransferase [Ktedonosporobacter rubrisoli]|nr:methyltransferase domain-containing protein [Ktedonosporobacter rubrisoli]